MNDSNWLENQCRSWTPRRPSARLEARLFGASHAADDAGAYAADDAGAAALGPAAWHWLAPSLAVFVLGLFVMGSQPPALPRLVPAWPGGLAAEVAVAQPEVAAWFDNSHRSERNRWLAATFDWTNGSHSLTTHPLIFSTNGAWP